MVYLYAYNDNIVNGLTANVLDIISLISIMAGLLVITTNNPVVSVLFLIGLFSSISTYLMMLGVHFIGLSYLLVYVGAVSILFLFILMLINVRISELLSNTKNSIPLAIIVAVSFNYSIYSKLPYNFNMFSNNIFNFKDIYQKFFFNSKLIEENNNDIFFVTSKVWDGNIVEISHISGIGNIMYTSYSIWLIITSIILLLAMIGVIVITVKNKN